MSTPASSLRRQQAMRLSGTAAGLGLGGFAIVWLLVDRASSKLAVILWGGACVAGLSLAAISWWGRQRGTTLATAGSVVLGAVAAVAQLLATPPGGDASTASRPDTSIGPSISPSTAPSSVPSPSSTPSRSPSTPRGIVPNLLVGRWDGGSQGSTAGGMYRFTADGDVEYSNSRTGVHELGTVVVKSDHMTFYFSGESPETVRWQTETFDTYGYHFTNLMLDGFSYVRQDAEPN